MAQYRTQARIVADILSTARDLSVDNGGVGITALLRKGNVSYSRMSKLITDLVGSGLLVETTDEKAAKYKISEKGLRFLAEFSQFENFSNSFGLRL